MHKQSMITHLSVFLFCTKIVLPKALSDGFIEGSPKFILQRLLLIVNKIRAPIHLGIIKPRHVSATFAHTTSLANPKRFQEFGQFLSSA